MSGRHTCARCTAHKPNGQRCSLNACKGGPYCWVHARSKLGLRVKPSHIPNAGLGLFAVNKSTQRGADATVFQKGEAIGEYTGRRVDDAGLQQVDKTWAVQLKQGRYVPAERSNDNFLRYANACRTKSKHGKKTCNGRLAVSHPRGGKAKAVIRATKNIHNNDEILWDYGMGYWKGRK